MAASRQSASIGVFLAVAVSAATAQHAVPPPPSAARAESNRQTDFRTLSRNFRDLAQQALLQVPEADRPRARLRLAIDGLAEAGSRPPNERSDAVRLVQQACSLLRDVDRESVDAQAAFSDYFEVERLWNRAAVALLEGWLHSLAIETHLRHALDRFPDDPHLRLARGVGIEGTHLNRVRLEDSADNSESRGRTLIGRFEAAQKYETVRTEATIRLGYALLRQNRTYHALEQFDAAASEASDPYLLYLTHLFRGQAFDRLERYDAAADAYRAATEAVPGAQTAAIALAVALTRTGLHDEATRVAAAATRNWSTPDPFLRYGTGDFRSWRTLMARLRDAVR